MQFTGLLHKSMVYVHTHNVRIIMRENMRVSNVSVSQRQITDKSDFKSHTVIDSQSVYQVLYMANKMFPGEWNKNKNQFKIYLNSNGIPVFGGMGVEKSIAGPNTYDLKLDYAIFGRTFPYMKQYANTHNQCVFVMPGNQKLPGTHRVEEIADLGLSQLSESMFYANPKNFDFTLRHKLIEAAKVQIEHIIAKQIAKDSVDSKDLLYQCLSRLVALAPAEYLDRPTIVRDYGGVLYDELTEGAKFDMAVLRSIVDEQYQVLRTEHYDSERELFNQLSGRLLNRGKLKVLNNEPFLIHGNQKVALEIREVPVKLATRIHASFHYIHTPRTNGYTLGLYIKGDSLPLSVIAVEKADRQYKRVALSHYGINYNHVYELTRMYSCANSPHNTSSFMLAMTNAFLKHSDKLWEASISSFMPSYAGGLSMISGGFKDILYLKACRHHYVKLENGAQVTMTKRRIGSKESDVAINKTALMPVIELIHSRKRIDDGRLLVLKDDYR